MKTAKPMSIVERDRLLHEQFKVTVEELRRYINELHSEILPIMEGDSESCEFFDPGEVNFMSPLYSLDDTELGACLFAAGNAWKELTETLADLHRLTEEIRESRNGNT
jgi:hypothetical protein